MGLLDQLKLIKSTVLFVVLVVFHLIQEMLCQIIALTLPTFLSVDGEIQLSMYIIELEGTSQPHEFCAGILWYIYCSILFWPSSPLFLPQPFYSGLSWNIPIFIWSPVTLSMTVT